MNEQRKSPRKIANEVLEVSDQITGTLLGQVVNISAEGLMLLSTQQINVGSVYQLDLKLPRLIKNHSKIAFGAEAVWSSEAAQPDSFWTGFRMIDISEDCVLAVDELIFDWHVLD
ncbi:MAG: PilZ domain-containing protein [Gammaproteobacteria bacterium]|nr:PilZ domain-containing protein [Gammaproteobacteria bacterium]